MCPVRTCHVSPPDAATCRLSVGPRHLYGLPRQHCTACHVSTVRPATCPSPICHVSSSSSAMCHLLVGPCQPYGPATSTVRTDTCLYGQVQSAPKICLFGFSDRTRYLPHTDSVCDKNYTTGFRTTRRTQWHRFCLIPSTFIFEQF
jgi:hypothetical protein